MPRLNTTGLQYFSHDVNNSSDEKIEFIEAKFGLTGWAIYFKLLEKIYNNGYFIRWDERASILFADKIKVSHEKVLQVVEDCLKEGLFNTAKYSQFGILTSLSIQLRFVEACLKRKTIQMKKEYLLTVPKVPDWSKLIIEILSDSQNPLKDSLEPLSDSETPSKDTSGTQKKGKEKKGKESNSARPNESLFEEFWTEYPNKRNKDKALSQWNNLRVEDNEGLFGLIMDALRKYKTTRQWEDPKFVPFASNWLLYRRWKDDIESVERASVKQPEPESELECFKIDLEDFRD